MGGKMDEKRVKDIMVPLDRYGLVPQDATLVEAVRVLQKAQKNRDRDRQPFRAVLIIDEDRNVIGKLGELAFLKALEPKRNVQGDVRRMSDAGVSDQAINMLMSHYEFFQDKLSTLCMRAKDVRVKEVMHPITESIDADILLGEAIPKMILWDTLSVIVTSKGKTVGLLRISDICQEIAAQMIELSQGDTD